MTGPDQPAPDQPTPGPLGSRAAVAAAVDRCGSGADHGPAYPAGTDRPGHDDEDADAAGGDEAGWYR